MMETLITIVLWLWIGSMGVNIMFMKRAMEAGISLSSVSKGVFLGIVLGPLCLPFHLLLDAWLGDEKE